jgi:hypothetical protein
VSNNVASGNGGAGIAIGRPGLPAGSLTRLNNNRTVGNGLYGIVVHALAPAGKGITVSRSDSITNGTADLKDDNPTCGSNIWGDQIQFHKASPASCVH